MRTGSCERPIGNRPERCIIAAAQHAFGPVEPQFLAVRVEHFDQTIRQQREKIAGL